MYIFYNNALKLIKCEYCNILILQVIAKMKKFEVTHLRCKKNCLVQAHQL